MSEDKAKQPLQADADFFETKGYRGYNVDAMTGLYNKPYALSLARRAVEEGKRACVSLVMIDLDNFKSINDTYGHIFGDEVIRRFAEIVGSVVKGHGFAGRFGGDEFFLCLYDMQDEVMLRSYLKDICFRFKTSFPDKDHTFSCSMGIAEYPRNGEGFHLLFRKADRALYMAKFKGRNRYIIYKEALHGELNDDGDDRRIISVRDEQVRSDRTRVIADSISALLQCRTAPESAKEVIKDVFEQVIDAFWLQGISIYTGPDFTCAYRYGHYTDPVETAHYIAEPSVQALFNELGVFAGSTRNLRVEPIDSFHGELSRHSIVHTTHCIVGDREHVRALFTYDSEVDKGDVPSDVERDLLYLTRIVSGIMDF